MLIENESNWRTDDLESLVEFVQSLPDYIKSYWVYEDTLLLFRTCRKRKEKDKWSDEELEPKAAYFRKGQDTYQNTLVVELRSASKLKMDVLDSIAHIGEDYEQDMHSDDVIRVAQQIGQAIGSYNYRDLDYKGAAKKSLRVRKDKPHCPEAIRRRIAAMETKKWRIRRAAEQACEKIDEKIEKWSQKL